MTTATKAGGAVLPVVAHEYTDRRDGYRYVSNACASETLPEAIALTPHAPAQATIDELRAEVERLRVVEFNSAVQFRDAVQPLREEVERLKRERWVAIQRELDALKAKQIDESLEEAAQRRHQAKCAAIPFPSIETIDDKRAAQRYRWVMSGKSRFDVCEDGCAVGGEYANMNIAHEIKAAEALEAQAKDRT